MVPLEDGREGAPHGVVFIHPQILALGMNLPLTELVNNTLVYFRVAPSQLTVGARRVLQNFEALCSRFLSKACVREEFCAIYMMMKGPRYARSFFPPRGVVIS